MKAGKMRQVVTLQHNVGRKGSRFNETLEDWQVFEGASRIPAAVRSLGGKEQENASQRRVVLQYEIKIRWLPSVDDQMRFIYHDADGDRVLNIKSLTGIGEKQRDLRCTCTEDQDGAVRGGGVRPA